MKIKDNLKTFNVHIKYIYNKYKYIVIYNILLLICVTRIHKELDGNKNI